MTKPDSLLERYENDLKYLGDVLHSDLPDSAKLFFAELFLQFGFRDHWGISRPEWSPDPQCIAAIEALEAAGFIDVNRDGTELISVVRRIGIGRDRNPLT